MDSLGLEGIQHILNDISTKHQFLGGYCTCEKWQVRGKRENHRNKRAEHRKHVSEFLEE